MIITKVLEIISFKRSKWLEKYITFNTQKRNIVKSEFEKDFYKLIINGAFGEFLENFRNRLPIYFIRNFEYSKFIKKQSNLTFNGFQKSYKSYYSDTFKQIEVTMNKTIYVGFAILELSELHMYETFYDNSQTYFGQVNLHLHYVDTDGKILSKKTENILNGSKHIGLL